MYKLQHRGWANGWFTLRQYKTKRAAMVNLVKKKFEMPDTEWRVTTELDWLEMAAEEFKKRI